MIVKFTTNVFPGSLTLIMDIYSQKTKLRYDSSSFGVDVKNMLAEFKNVKTRIFNLGGEYLRYDLFLDLWNAVATISIWNSFVKKLEDDEVR